MRYASFILADEGSDMTADNLSAVIKAAGGKVEAYPHVCLIKPNLTLARPRKAGYHNLGQRIRG